MAFLNRWLVNITNIVKQKKSKKQEKEKKKKKIGKLMKGRKEEEAVRCNYFGLGTSGSCQVPRRVRTHFFYFIWLYSILFYSILFICGRQRHAGHKHHAEFISWIHWLEKRWIFQKKIISVKQRHLATTTATKCSFPSYPLSIQRNIIRISIK